MKISVVPKNEVYVQLDCEMSLRHEISEYFTFYVEGYKFMPKYKSGQWDGKIRLYNLWTNEFYKGLIPHLHQFAEAREYKVECDASTTIHPIDFDKFPLPPQFDIRDYQRKGINSAIVAERATLLSATGSGKSLMQYFLIRHYQNLLPPDKKLLIIVPTTSLVNQMYTDFEEYSSVDPTWNVEDNCHTIMAGKDKNTEHQIQISTWQSLQRLPKKHFLQYGFINVDECICGDTLIKTPNGDKKISNIKTGDKIFSYDESTNEFVVDDVVSLHKNLTISSPEKMYRLDFDNGVVIDATGNHKFLTENRGYVRADALLETDSIINTYSVTEQKQRKCKDEPENTQKTSEN